ncbi:tetratricopeptide repeat protein [Ruegeria atlantica]|uniref:tetratricopeptide repeat protein n=1 Tax=Ruegeria atlantica TaxID=81569 RepID=UPI00147B234A
MSSAKGVFVGQRKDRMGARLLMMLTCIRLAEDFDTTYRVNWFPQGADAPELDQPQELFAQGWMDDHFLSPKEFDAFSTNSLPIWSFQNDSSPDRLIEHLNAGRSVIVEEGFEVLAFPWEDIEAIRPRYRDFIHRVGFTEEIREVMDCADAKLSGQGVSAYHIRRGDILNGLPWKHTTWPAKIEPEELYEAHLEKNADKTAIMFSDQPELITRFQKRFPKLLQMGDIADVSGMTRAKRDFLELYAMSRAEQVVAPVISAFSMAAARISGQQRKVFRDVLTDDEISYANEASIARLRKGGSGFLNASEAAHIYSKALFHMNRLDSDDRTDEALNIAAELLDNGADNAFLPLLQALNLFYAGKWDDASDMVDSALQNPNIWPEDYAVCSALKAAALGEKRKRWQAAQAFSRAFWAKPIRPDVLVFGSRVVYRDQIALRLFPPTDWSLQKVIRRPWFNFNSHVAQRKVLVRLPCNFDFLLLDWSELSLDQKARRLFDNQPRLKQLHDGLTRMTDMPDTDPRVRSFSAKLEAHLGEISNAAAIDITRKVLSEVPDNPLYHKRLSDLYQAEGDTTAARITMADALACDPGNAFLVFATGQMLEKNGAVEQGQSQIIQAAEIDDDTAAIQGEAGRLLLQRGEKEAARGFLQKAHDLCPKFKRFSNQLKRAGG